LNTNPPLIAPVRQVVWGVPALFNLCAGGAGAALYGLTFLLPLRGGGVRVLGLPQVDFIRLVCVLLVAAGFAAVGVESRKPLNARFLLHHLKRSWMSREVLAGALLMILALLDIATSHAIFRLGAFCTAMLLLACQVLMVYDARGVTVWNRPLTALHALSSNIYLACGLGLILGTLGAPVKAGGMVLVGLMGLVLNLFAWWALLKSLTDSDLRVSLQPLISPLRLIISIGVGHLLPALVLTLAMGVEVLLSANTTLEILHVLSGVMIIVGVVVQKAAVILGANWLKAITPGPVRTGRLIHDDYPQIPFETMPPFHFQSRSTHSRIQRRWIRFWMRFAGLGPGGRIATRLASITAHPHKARVYLARLNPRGYISTKAVLFHTDFRYGSHIFIDDRVVLFQREQGGPLVLGDRVYIYRDTILETGYGGSLTIGDEASIHPRCQVHAYVSDIRIGPGVMLAPGCALYPYDHGTDRNRPIREQPLVSKGGIEIGEEAWLSFGVIVLGGVRIGSGAVIGAGSVVTGDIPDHAIAIGRPAKVVKYRS